MSPLPSSSPSFYCWAWCCMAWNIPLATCLGCVSSQLLTFLLCLLEGQIGKKKKSFGANTTHSHNIAPFWLLWRKLTPTQPDTVLSILSGIRFPFWLRSCHMGSRTCTVVEWRDRDGRDQQLSAERQDWRLFVGHLSLVLVGLFLWLPLNACLTSTRRGFCTY